MRKAGPVRILVGWDDPEQADLIALYLDVEGNELLIAKDDAELLAESDGRQKWDVILLATSSPHLDHAFELFQGIRARRPEAPVVGACGTSDVYRMARFMTAGMRSYVLRDAGAEYLFLLQASLENVVAAVRAEREQKIAERLREEIDSVRKLQESIIPRNLKSPPDYGICARYEPSQVRVFGGRPVLMAGGDYYDVFSLDEKNLVVLVGDASGHGMKACMSIMTMHTLVRMIRNREYQDPAVFVAEVNRQLCEQSIISAEGGFITLLYGILRADTNEFQWTSAGHPPPLVYCLDDEAGSRFGDPDAGGMPLGVFADAEYESYITPIPPRSRLLLYTDGLIEAFPDNGAEHCEFGIKGVLESMVRTRDLPIAGALQSLFDDTHAFTQGSGRHDDTSAVLIERH